jgi:hypothetical protein
MPHRGELIDAVDRDPDAAFIHDDCKIAVMSLLFNGSFQDPEKTTSRSNMNASIRLALLIVSLLLVPVAAYAQQTAAPSPAAVNGVPAAALNGQASPPRCDANCVRENAAKAADACAPRIEKEAPSDFDWIIRPNPGIFQQADPSSPADSVVRYRGDSVRFMTVDKAWVRVSYECAYDVSKQAVASVQVRSGRLDQPLTPVQTKPVASADAPVVRAAVPAAPVANGQAARPAKPRVWEPSPIVIQQQSPNPKPH